MYSRPLRGGGYWSSTLAWGQNREQDHRSTDGFLLESHLNLRNRDLLFARAEVATKSDHDLAVPPDPLLFFPPERIFDLGKLEAGYVRELRPVGGILPGVGVGATFSWVDDRLKDLYGEQNPVGAYMFGIFRPAPVSPSHAH